jgi:single-strand DNA-binding protein
MISLNKVFLVGHLVRDPDLRYTPAGTPVSEFRMSVSDNYVTHAGDRRSRTSYIDVVSWRKLAETCADYLSKGSPVFVEGRLEQDSWENSEGHRRSRIRVVAYTVQFLDRDALKQGSRPMGAIEGGGRIVSDVTTSGRFAPVTEEDYGPGSRGDLDDIDSGEDDFGNRR